MNTLLGLITGAGLSVGLATAAAAETTIFYGHPGPARGPAPATLNWFADRVEELSGGDLKFDIQYGGALFKAPASVPSVSRGVSDGGTIISAYFQKEMAAYSLADLPIGGANSWVSMRATDRLMRTVPEVTEHLAKQNLVYIGTMTASSVNLACKGVEVNTIEDVEGLKVRGAGVYGKVFGELGATMVSMSVYEAYQGLDTGLLDCTQGYDYVVDALKWGEQISSYTVMNWGQIGGYGVFMNKQTYDALTDAQREVLTQAGTEMSDVFAENVTNANSAAIDGMQANADISVISVTADEVARLNSASEPFVEAWKENAASVGLDPDQLIEVFTAAVEEYAAEYDAKGYPWNRSN
ncbi:ABC transporter substrate-binding protein [Roseobacter cerasinus]|uniref:ABC transporter substrate-binding protein n=1 Tax=Roseobacter cerasinus TaxID=2602289 RepID=A0A640VZA2_9RHOB|nr:C4-dicarboxylate TRAP transporter substrate-binding protein [Roseobacter cerasinus]GFE52431.1 ABC transporter substrate-binding protein [Roseobacter cerasinus]